MNIIDRLVKGNNLIALAVHTQAELDLVIEYLTWTHSFTVDEFDCGVTMPEGGSRILIRDSTIKDISLSDCFKLGYTLYHLNKEIPDSNLPQEFRLNVSAQGSREEIADALILISKSILKNYSREIEDTQYLDGIASLDTFRPVIK